jgi:tetratricopeptide (TPR) repeat protein
MQRRPDHIARKVVPRWRSLADTPRHELLTSKSNPKLAPVVSDTSEVIAAWRADRGIASGAELLATVPLLGLTEDSLAAAAFLDERRDDLAPGVAQLLDWVNLSQRQGPKNDAPSQPPGSLRAAIRQFKAVLSTAPNSPITLIERARLHTMLGQTTAAERSIRAATALAPENRFVLRSAARFFVSRNKPDEALHILSDTGNDPWLIASKVAVTELAGERFDDARRARSLIDNGDPGQISELAAAMATLDLSDGGTKRAKKLFKRSAEKPNENAVAQLSWANEEIGLPFDAKLLTTDRSFEARAVQAEREKDWKLAVKQAQLWVNDEPFARRPVAEGCYWASELLRNYELAELFANLGLMSHPGDAAFLNNRAYARINLGKFSQAREDIAMAKSKPGSASNRFILQATEGCLAFREGDPNLGAERYRGAIERAKELKEVSLAQQALVHWCFEEFRCGRLFAPELLFALNDFFSDKKRAYEGISDVYRAHFTGIEGARTGQGSHTQGVADVIASLPVRVD